MQVLLPSDENGPIGKLNKITNSIGYSFRFDYGSSSIKDVLSTSIDSLDNDMKLHVGIIGANGTYICLIQKYINSDYASGLVFGYGSDKLYFQIKYRSWQTIREI